MYQEMRRKKYERSEQDAYEYLNRADWGVLSLCAEGLPYGVPVNHAVSGKTIYFHCALEGQKLDFIRANPNACFTAVASAAVMRTKGSTAYESVMAFGSVRIVEDEADRIAGFNAINAKFTDGEELGRSFFEKWGKAARVLAMDIERITAKAIPEEQ